MARRARAVLVALVAIVGWMGATGQVGAHGGDIRISVSPGSVSGNNVSYTVTLEWDDGHAVEGEPVSVTANGPGGTRSANFPPTNSAGRTSGSITLSPGTWSVTFRADGFSRTISQTIAAPTTTAPPPTAPPTTKPPTPTAPPTTRQPSATSPPTTNPPATSRPPAAPPTAAGPSPRPGNPPSGQPAAGQATTTTSRPRSTTTQSAPEPTAEARVEAAVEELAPESGVETNPATTFEPTSNTARTATTLSTPAGELEIATDKPATNRNSVGWLAGGIAVAMVLGGVGAIVRRRGR